MKAAGVFIISLFVAWAGYGSDSQETQRETQRADSALKQGDPQAKLSNDDASRTKDPRVEAYRLRAQAILDSSRFRRALEDAEAGLKLDPDNRQLRELRDLATAHLKLANREASIVENTRYPIANESTSLSATPVEQLSFGDLARQRQELRELVERNPFWKTSTHVQREAYIQDILGIDPEFMSLAVSRERAQLTKDESVARKYRDQFDLDMLLTFGPDPYGWTRQAMGPEEIYFENRRLLSPDQRSAIVHDIVKLDVNIQELQLAAYLPVAVCLNCSWDDIRPCIRAVTKQYPSRFSKDEKRSKVVHYDEQRMRRLSTDISFPRMGRNDVPSTDRIYNFSNMGASR